MHTGYARHRWQRASGGILLFLVVSAIAVLGLLPEGAGAQPLKSPARPAGRQSALWAASTPGSSPTITPTPAQGPVKTLVTLQGTGWPAGSQVMLYYDSSSDCAASNLTELSSDPQPTASNSGAFNVSFSWPTVSATGVWYICATTSDGAAAAVASFDVLSLSPPSLTILTKGPFMPGQMLTVQGQNWFPGGWNISFALQPVKSSASYSLEETAISLFNGTFDSTSLTIPTYLPPGSYVLVATMEQQALEAQSAAITLLAPPTPTPTATPSPSPTPIITVTPTPSRGHAQPASPPRRLSGTLLALVIISGGMALSFALIGAALLLYLMRTRARPSAPLALERFDETEG